MARLGPLLAIAMMLILLLLPFIGLTEFWQLEIVLMICYALVVSGVNLGFGFAGELALGQVGVFAAGAYLSAWLMMNGYDDVVLCVLASAAAGAIIGLVTGLPGLRIGGWALAMTSFFF